MSHYTVAVFVDDEGKTLEELLSPYNEDLKIPHYITKDELIQKERERFEEFKNGLYAEYLKNPSEYISKCKNDAHIKYISEEFPKRLLWTDDDFYNEAIRYEKKENIREDGSVYSDYNQNSKWDWYVVGGRWGSEIILKNGNVADYAKVKDINFDAMHPFRTYAVLTPDGKWNAPGEMGYWAMSTETEDEWKIWSENYKKLFIDTANPEWVMYIVDCHI